MNDLAPETVQARVARGAALLDEKLPGWDQRIDLDRLNLGDCFTCILGQLFTDQGWAELEVTPYVLGASELLELHPDEVSILFSRKPGQYAFTGAPEDLDKDEAFTALTEEWCTLIRARRAA